jgi:c-di-GMP-binding flagellar brake protein YcgR
MNDVIMSTPPSSSFLTVGLSLKLSLMLDRQKVMYGSALLGWKDHAWLVCEWPVQLGHTTEIPKGIPCTVNYLHEGKLVGYKTEIRDLITSPVPLLFLAFPQTVEEMHLRKYARVASSEPALLTRTDTSVQPSASALVNDFAGGLVKDLSLGGCSIAVTKVPDWLRQGSTLRMEFELPGMGHVTNLTGIVKNVEERGGTETVGVEFQFDGMEYIEYRGWGGSVRQAIEQWTMQKSTDPFSLR